MTHTPGPWTVGNAYDCAKEHAITSGWRVLARVNGDGYPVGTGWAPESAATAKLMASAPDLLEKLQWLINVATHPKSTKAQIRTIAEDARAAIAKATGE